MPVASSKDKEWQKKIEQKLKNEKVELNHPNGKERFRETLKRVIKKKSSK